MVVDNFDASSFNSTDMMKSEILQTVKQFTLKLCMWVVVMADQESRSIFNCSCCR